MNASKKRKASQLAAIVCGLLAVGALVFGSGTRAVRATTDEWEIVADGGLIPQSGFLFGVSSIGPSDVWGVGYNGTSTLIRHWNGSAWSTVSSPNPGSGGNLLRGVVAISSNDAWAVGYTYDSDGDMPDMDNPEDGYGEEALIVHWNGSSWSTVSAPLPQYATEVSLNAVAAVDDDNVWAVGNYYDTNETKRKTFVVHYNGTLWSTVTSPSPGTSSNFLQSVTVIPGTSNLWAVGYKSSGGAFQTLTLYSTGGSWSAVTSPNNGGYANDLRGVVAFSEYDARSVGHKKETSNGSNLTLTLAWDGEEWTFVESPEPSGDVTKGLWGTSAYASDNIWAVGFYQTGGVYKTLAERWDGSSWSIVTPPNQGADNNELFAVHIVPGGGCDVRYAWAVGAYKTTGPTYRPLTLRYTTPSPCSP